MNNITSMINNSFAEVFARPTVLDRYGDFEGLSIRDKHKRRKVISDEIKALQDVDNDILRDIENTEPERIECECCEGNNTTIDYDYLDDVMVWCSTCTDYTHLAKPSWDTETSDQMAEAGTHNIFGSNK